MSFLWNTPQNNVEKENKRIETPRFCGENAEKLLSETK